jgi:hypothetical protein
VTTAEPPYVDAHHTTIEASSQVVWRTLRAYVDRMLEVADGSLFTRLLGTQPSAGFAIADEEPERQLVLAGRHRFSRYRLVFELEPTDGGTILRALTYAAFPGLHGRVYRLIVISSRAHVLATRRMLTAIRRACRT